MALGAVFPFPFSIKSSRSTRKSYGELSILNSVILLLKDFKLNHVVYLQNLVNWNFWII
jgi:hypothetical protein